MGRGRQRRVALNLAMTPLFTYPFKHCSVIVRVTRPLFKYLNPYLKLLKYCTPVGLHIPVALVIYKEISRTRAEHIDIPGLFRPAGSAHESRKSCANYSKGWREVAPAPSPISLAAQLWFFFWLRAKGIRCRTEIFYYLFCFLFPKYKKLSTQEILPQLES